MPDLALRRRIAELRGWGDFYEPIDSPPQTLSGKNPHGIRVTPVPTWDCDPDAALDLWAEIPTYRRIGETPHSIRATQESDGNPFGRIHVADVMAEECPDQKERLCLAIARLWLAWREAQA